VWDALGKGIKSTDPTHLMTYHPWGERSSSEWFHQSAKRFNITNRTRPAQLFHLPLSEDYNHTIKLRREPRYEDHPINPIHGWFNEMHVRQAAYRTVWRTWPTYFVTRLANAAPGREL
jgi:hypothetical protein